MGLFALYVVIVSLVRCLAIEEFPRLTAMKLLWGRRRGLAIHFLSNVALPSVLGIVFLTQGVVAGRNPQAVNSPRAQFYQSTTKFAASEQASADPGPEVAGSRSAPQIFSSRHLSQQFQWLKDLP